MAVRMIRRHAEAGATLLELVFVLGLLVSLSALSVPMAAAAIDRGRVRQAATFVSSRFRLARHQAIFGGRSIGIVFDQIAGRWTFRVCTDGNGNGIRRAELESVDRCHEGPHEMQALFPTVAVAKDPAIPDPGGAAGSADAVRFGVSDMISFSSNGSCTPGSLYLRSPQGTQYAVRIAGATGRLRLLRFDPVSGQWTLP